MKKKKRIKLDKKTKVIIIISVIVFAFVSALIAAVITKNTEVPSVKQVEISIKELVEKNGCEYISDTESTEEGYDIDIYLKFGRDPVVDGISSEPYYGTVCDSIANETGYLSVRLIDESREITVKIKCSNGSVESVYINDVTKEEYFRKLLSEYAKQKPLEVTPISMSVSSIELTNLINNN